MGAWGGAAEVVLDLRDIATKRQGRGEPAAQQHTTTAEAARAMPGKQIASACNS